MSTSNGEFPAVDYRAMADDLIRLGNDLRIERDLLRAENERLRERDSAAQTLIGLLRYHLVQYGHEAGGKDFRPYRDYKALDPLAGLSASQSVEQ